MADTCFTSCRCKGRSSMTTDHTITYSVFEPKKPRSDRSPFLLSLLLSLPVHPPAEQPHTCRSPDLRIVAFIRLPGLPVAGFRLNECSPITVAGPLRNCTGFPLSSPNGKNMCGLFRSDILYPCRSFFVNRYLVWIVPEDPYLHHCCSQGMDSWQFRLSMVKVDSGRQHSSMVRSTSSMSMVPSCRGACRSLLPSLLCR